MFDRLLIVWLSLVSLLAWRWPEWFPAVSDPFLGGSAYLYHLVAVTMFAIGWMLPRDEIEQVRQRWPMVLVGTTLQYTSMPLLGWSVGWLMGLDADARLGLFLVGCVPDAMASGVLTLAAGGNVSYAVSLTTCSTLLSPLVVPTALRLVLGESESINLFAEGWQLAWVVVFPVLCGHGLARLWPAAQSAVNRFAPAVANFTILAIIAVVVAKNRGSLVPRDSHSLGSLGWLVTAILLVNILGYAAGYYGGKMCRLSEPMTRALTLVVGMQNAGLGSAIALRVFADRPAVAIPCAIYTLLSVYTAFVLAFIWKRHDRTQQAASVAQTISK